YPKGPDDSVKKAIREKKNGRKEEIFGETAVGEDMQGKEQRKAFVGEKVKKKKYCGNGVGIGGNKERKDV
ncbi:arginine ABC transporter substrate-binding protein, partial [Pasteurella multocida]|nr:arginine ABC transporter substrate-binding protein [Pasteurella multocida]